MLRSAFLSSSSTDDWSEPSRSFSTAFLKSSGVGGAGVAVIDPTLFTEFFLAALASTDVPEGELGVFMDMVEAADEHIGGACLSEGWMNARSVGGRFLTR